jgi:hypothetical protein
VRAILFSLSCLVSAPALAADPIKVVVVDYDPVLKTQGGAKLSTHMKWNDPRALTDAVVRDLRDASGGRADYQVVDFLEVDDYPAKRDGFRYDETSFLAMWADRSKAHQPDSVSYKAIFDRFHLEERIRKEGIGEVWLWGAPYFGWDEYAMKIPGDLLYHSTENPWFYRPYDLPDCGRTVWVMGWNYERGEAEALHSFGHRCEGILSLTVGRGVWDNQKSPNNVWNRFTHLAKDFPNDAQCGNVHGGPNAKDGYDYAQKEAVLSGADDWLEYPKLAGKKTRVSCETWGGPDYHLNYMRWWLRHLPRGAGETDGYLNDWWSYVLRYDDAVKRLPPGGGKPAPATCCMR